MAIEEGYTDYIWNTEGSKMNKQQAIDAAFEWAREKINDFERKRSVRIFPRYGQNEIQAYVNGPDGNIIYSESFEFEIPQPVPGDKEPVYVKSDDSSFWFPRVSTGKTDDNGHIITYMENGLECPWSQWKPWDQKELQSKQE